MRGIYYFLNERFVNDPKNKNPNFLIPAPFSTLRKFEMDAKIQIESDEFSYEYIRAWSSIKSGAETFNDINSMNLVKLFLVDSDLYEKDFAKILARIQKIKKYDKPKDHDEWTIHNFMTAIKIVENKILKINRENFEAIIHILFKNTNIDLSEKSKYTRHDIETDLLKGIIHPKFIESEMDALFKYIDKIPSRNLEFGLTQGIIIFLYFLKISPFIKSNILVAFVMFVWYMNQQDIKDEFPSQIYIFTNYLDEIFLLLNIAFNNDMVIDDCLLMIKKSILKNINDSSRLKSVRMWNEHNQKKIFENDERFINIYHWIISQILGIDDEITDNEIIKTFTFDNRMLIPKGTISECVKKLVDNKLIIKTNKKYEITDIALLKIRSMLKNKIILK